MSAKKKRPRSKRGKTVNWTEPKWEPLLHLARIYVDEFMWMGEVELTGGTLPAKRFFSLEETWEEAQDGQEGSDEADDTRVPPF
jgi:hypothetical protein